MIHTHSFWYRSMGIGILLSLTAVMYVIHAPANHRVPEQDELVTMLAMPVYADPEQMVDFFEQQFQHSAYPSLIIPASLEHMAQLISYAPLARNPVEYAHTILHICSQRMRAAPWIDPIALLIFLQKTHPIMAQLTMQDETHELQERIAHFLHERMYRFIDTYMAPATLSRAYLQDTSVSMHETPYLRAIRAIDEESFIWAQQIGDMARQASRQQQIHELMHAWAILLDTALSRLIWSPTTGVDSWRSACAIATQLVDSWHEHILPTTDRLNDLLWALLSRYGYFCELMYPALSPELLLHIQQDLASPEYGWLDLPEQDMLMIGKRRYFKELLFALAVEKELEHSLVSNQAPA